MAIIKNWDKKLQQVSMALPKKTPSINIQTKDNNINNKLENILQENSNEQKIKKIGEL